LTRKDRLGLSECRACQITGQDRSTQRHQSGPASEDAAVRDRLWELSGEHPRWGDRRAHAYVAGEGFEPPPEDLPALLFAVTKRAPERAVEVTMTVRDDLKLDGSVGRRRGVPDNRPYVK